MVQATVPTASTLTAGLSSNGTEVRQRVPVIADNHRKSTPKYAPTNPKSDPQSQLANRLSYYLY